MDSETAVIERLHHASQQHAAVDVLEGGIGIREVMTNVAEAGSAEQRITERMQQDITVRMCLKAEVIRDLNTAENQSAIRCKAMGINALPD
jgi:head-tail adaptor